MSSASASPGRHGGLPTGLPLALKRRDGDGWLPTRGLLLLLLLELQVELLELLLPVLELVLELLLPVLVVSASAQCGGCVRWSRV